MRFTEHAFSRFLVWGAVNTVSSYLVYLALLLLLDYRWAYTIAFALGVVLSYAVCTGFVFRGRWSWGRAARFPGVYAVQYVAGIALLWVLVGKLGMDDREAPFVVIVVTVPLTYFLSRAVIGPERTP